MNLGKVLGAFGPLHGSWVGVGMERQRRANALGSCSTSGESGSGKTEATKLILRCLAAMNQRRDVMQQVRPTIQPSCGCPVCLGSLAQHPC